MKKRNKKKRKRKNCEIGGGKEGGYGVGKK